MLYLIFACMGTSISLQLCCLLTTQDNMHHAACMVPP